MTNDDFEKLPEEDQEALKLGLEILKKRKRKRIYHYIVPAVIIITLVLLIGYYKYTLYYSTPKNLENPSEEYAAFQEIEDNLEFRPLHFWLYPDTAMYVNSTINTKDGKALLSYKIKNNFLDCEIYLNKPQIYDVEFREPNISEYAFTTAETEYGYIVTSVYDDVFYVIRTDMKLEDLKYVLQGFSKW